MKIIDLLNKIANGEELPLIKYRGKILHWNKEKDRFEDKDSMNTLYEIYFSELNDEVEIIEEDKTIKKVDRQKCVDFGDTLEKTLDKLDEIIDKLNEEEK